MLENVFQFRSRCGSNFHTNAVVGEDFEFLDVVIRFSSHDGMNAAGVIANHPPESAAVMRGRIGRKGEMVFFSGGAEMIEHHSRLYAGDSAGRINFKNRRHVSGEIEDDGDVAALAGKRSAAAAAKQGCTEIAAECDRGDHIVCIARQHYADRNLAVIRAVGGVECAAAAIEANFAANARTQSFTQA